VRDFLKRVLAIQMGEMVLEAGNPPFSFFLSKMMFLFRWVIFHYTVDASLLEGTLQYLGDAKMKG